MVIAALLASCAGIAPQIVSPGHDGDFAPAIPDAATWQLLAARAGSETLARVEVVKVLYDTTDQHLYFTQSRKWPIHYDFANQFLSTPGDLIVDHWLFNQHEYHDADRRFVLGSVTHYLDQDTWTFELFAGDLLDLDATARVFAAVRAAVWTGDRLRYRPVPAAHVAAVDRARAVMPVVTTEELFAGLHYQPVEPGEAWGYVRIVPAGRAVADRLASVRHRRARHAAARAAAGRGRDHRRAASAARSPRGPRAQPEHARHGAAWRDRPARVDRARRVAGARRRRRVGLHDRSGDAGRSRSRRARARQARPAVRLSPDDVGLPVLAKIAGDDIVHFGAKTAQLAKVAGLRGVRTPRAFGLPFAAYAQFLAANGLDRRIAALLADPAFAADPQRRRAALDELRAAIDAAPVPAEDRAIG